MTIPKDPLSPAQRQRQAKEHRSGGQYAKVNPCNACGKSAGVNYFSDHRTDVIDGFSDYICLCRKCAAKGEAIEDPEAALAFYANGGSGKKAK